MTLAPRLPPSETTSCQALLRVLGRFMEAIAVGGFQTR
jgi:hypothetical protein